MLDRMGMPVVQAINICGQILPARACDLAHIAAGR
jgi:hypothetical protein